jgi:beta-lactamase regulating signal transducer with metallopeptidase domain
MKNLIIRIAVLLGIISSMAMAPLTASAAINCASPDLSAKEQLQCGSCQAGTEANCTPGTAPKTLSDTIATVINLLSVFGGAIAVIMIIVGGFRYITSAGSPEATKSARNTIVYALIGLVIIATAQIIVHFVINNVKDCPNGKTATGQCK